MNMNAVGIDVSKGKSMVAILRSYGEIIQNHLKSNTQSVGFALSLSRSNPLMANLVLSWNTPVVITNLLSVNFES